MHQCAKQLLRDVIMTQQPDLQIKNLRKVYCWYLTKLEMLGDLTLEDKEEAKILLEPDSVAEEA
jgi:hypothetical protein